ncbi:MAG: thymidylate kinase [Patescibacteria group bacterium]|nr:thymidylate kinase [Patescibacteria group bacterium]
MLKNNYKGKFIALEGIDGSGKSTQSKLLTNRLKKEGYKIAFIDFPQYGKKSAGLVEEYLNGNYGTSKEVGPYRASIFYACDRFDASFQIRDWLKQGKIIITDRYVGSNIGHQGGKIKNRKERNKFLNWLYELEYSIFNIPKPNFSFIFKMPPLIARDLSGKITDKIKKAKKKIYLGRKKRDIHEKDLKHLSDTEKSYLEIAKQFPKDFKIIECFKNGKLLSPNIIHDDVWRIIQKTL